MSADFVVASGNVDLDQVQANYERDGFAIIRGVFSVDEMAELQAQWDDLKEPLSAGETIDGMYRFNFYIYGKIGGPIGTAHKDPRVVQIVQELVGPNVALYMNRMNVKDSYFTDPIHLHQDFPYFNGSTDKINTFLALQHINLNNGAMVYVSGSHKIGVLDRETIDISKHPELNVVIPSLSPGDFVIADIRTWHSSVPNTVGTDRVLLQMIFQPASDGSYFLRSIPEPTLVAGSWKTKNFEAWDPAGIGNDSGKDAASEAAELEPAEEIQVAAEAQDALESDSLVQMAKRAVPNWIKRPIKQVLMPKPIPGAPTDAAPAESMRDLPRLFTVSTGPTQVWPLNEVDMDWDAELDPTANYLKNSYKTDILLGVRGPIDEQIVSGFTRRGLNVKGYLHVQNPGEPDIPQTSDLSVYKPDDLKQISGIDAVVVLATMDWGLVLRRCEQFLRQDILFLPAAREAAAPEPIREATVADWAKKSAILTYLQVSGLRGHFAEFGTFWGRSFFSSYYELHHWLSGNFYAFDSFEGLSKPDPRETLYTPDFIKAAYGFNHASFRAIGEILDLDKKRFISIPGFFDKSLTPSCAEEIGITPKSLSVCRIDCDLYAPSLDVLRFISPLLDDGALIYFDDWRLCRADPNIGERGAVLTWLHENPTFELVDFHTSHWQHQWFIFHRNKPQF